MARPGAHQAVEDEVGAGRHVCLRSPATGVATSAAGAVGQAFGAGALVVYLRAGSAAEPLEQLDAAPWDPRRAATTGQLVVVDAGAAAESDAGRRDLVAATADHVALAFTRGLACARVVVDLGDVYRSASRDAILDWELYLGDLASTTGTQVVCVVDGTHPDHGTQALVEAVHDETRPGPDAADAPLAYIWSTGYPGGLEVAGELDASNAALLERAVLAASRGSHGVELDLSGVGFVDLAAVRALLSVAVRLGPGRELLVRRPPPALGRLLELCGWDRFGLRIEA